MRIQIILSLLATFAGVVAIAQEREVRVKSEIRVAGPVSGDHVLFAPQAFEIAIDGPESTFEFVKPLMHFEGKPVKGAPYSAEAVTETVQNLADGNRISRKSTGQVYRDGQGRTRRDNQIAAIGPFSASGEAPQITMIHDPVAGVEYILDARNKTARKIALPGELLRNALRDAHKEAAMSAGIAIKGPANVDEIKMIGPGAVARKMAAKGQTESLSKRMIEGLEAEGSRTTFTIAAGEIGNDRPIEVVSERWYSPELQTLVMSRRSDPRFGETTFKLTRINRSEPLRSLFEVPADYTLREEKPHLQILRKEEAK
jgi:hypothetical protein